jgi:hypothetical protein
MFPPLFAFLSASTITGPVLGVGAACRVKPYGEAAADIAKPYAVWQIISGVPYNTLADIPAGDRVTCQFDVYGDTDAQARAAFEPLRFELERLGSIVSYHGNNRDPDTGAYRIGFDWEYVGKRTWTPPSSGGSDD